MPSGISKLLILESNSEVTTLNGFSTTLNYKVTTMEADVNPSVVCVVLILMAAVSLFAMISLNQINYIVHGDLYSFGLQFSYRWAIPYWLFSGIVFGLSWMNIAIAIIVTLYIFKKRQRQALAFKSSQREAVKAAQIKEKKEQRKISEYVQPQKQGLIASKEELIEPLSKETKQPWETTETVEEQEIFSQQMTEEKSESVKETEEAHVPSQNFEKRQSIP